MNVKINKSVAFTLASIIFQFLIATPAVAQFLPLSNGVSLKGVTSFDAQFIVSNWLNVTRERSQFVRQGQTAFELALRRDGVIVDTSAPNYLYCEIRVAESSDGLIFYTYSVEFYGFNSEGLHPLLWVNGGVVTIGSSNFNAETATQDCADSFANEWLKQNPK